ncbi:DNA-3-methyladenine glycosylase family protein [Acidihalobacter prosperus]|uniref:DNA-3-methyladenine glycosylase II n=1 Tax=Acidihalobacter prosperus TaxID=160660 RepID=A0A1A6C7M8_9GAMM|nr:DNA-3-methyladenine glycosylase [Acidihalobacter prosperus]OBS10555.1 hypothetical protein Thpro_020271 [Acidihalobacter prosperus]
MARVLAAIGPCRLRPRDAPFVTLCTSIVGQQLSTRAAGTIRARLEALLGGPPSPAALAGVDAGDLRAVGLSGAKTRYLQALAQAQLDGTLDFAGLAALPDAAALERLTALPGVGRWTAEMFLIFGLGRLDVISLGDAGLRRAARMLYGEDMELGTVSAPWAPYRSVAAWYLWQHLDG